MEKIIAYQNLVHNLYNLYNQFKNYNTNYIMSTDTQLQEEVKEIKKIKEEDNNPNYHLLFSTSTFIFPIFYSLQKKNIVLSTATGIALFGSINHWRKPKHGYRRNIDLVTSNLSLITYFYYGYTNIICLYPRLIGYASLGFLGYLYNKSYTKFYLQDKTWVNYHMGFHFLTSISKIFVIYCV